MINKGQILPNGATVLDIDSRITRFGRDYYVLADFGHEYVTWAVDPARPESTCWGSLLQQGSGSRPKGLI